MNDPQISTDVPTMCFSIFELLTEIEEEWFKQIAVIFRCVSFSVTWRFVLGVLVSTK